MLNASEISVKSKTKHVRWISPHVVIDLSQSKFYEVMVAE